MERELAELQQRFTVAGAEIVPGPGKLPMVNINNQFAIASLTLHGAHLLSYIPRGESDLLWVSKSSWFEAGKPIRGGIPVCWPWFGSHPDNDALPSHGFARLAEWDLESISQLDDGSHCVVLALEDSSATRAMWDYRFRLELKVTVGKRLQVELLMRNRDTRPFDISAALHSYFAVSDITAVKISGLEQCRYLDTLDNCEKVQQGEIVFTAETDNLYLDTAATVYIRDAGAARTIEVAKRGSNSTVVWNPWVAKAARMPDFGDEEYRQMVCVETVNAENDSRRLQPGDEHRLETIISV